MDECVAASASLENGQPAMALGFSAATCPGIIDAYACFTTVTTVINTTTVTDTNDTDTTTTTTITPLYCVHGCVNVSVQWNINEGEGQLAGVVLWEVMEDFTNTTLWNGEGNSTVCVQPGNTYTLIAVDALERGE